MNTIRKHGIQMITVRQDLADRSAVFNPFSTAPADWIVQFLVSTLRQGLTFEGVTCDLLPGTADCYVVKGDGYELRTTAGNGCCPVDALARASQVDWTEIN